MRLRASEVASISGGSVTTPLETRELECLGLTWDSRQVVAGDLYLALPGERVDGHDFVASALEKGAVCALIEHELEEAQMQVVSECGAALVRVDSTARAIEALSAAWRARCSALVIALTGSNGKTTTKNLVAQVLSSFGRTVATHGNQNNELGVPATLLRIDEDTRFAVVEMGMRGLNQLSPLCELAQPDMALVTNVGTSHMELLGSRINIARAKAEPFESLCDGGVAFINSSDEYREELRRFGGTCREGIEELFFDGSGADPLSYPEDVRPRVYAQGIEVDDRGCASFVLHLPDSSAHCSLGMGGLHNVHNALAAAAVGWRVGMNADQIVRALESARAEAGRQQVIASSSGITLIDDAYNANPDSMRASLSMFAAMRVAGRRFAVLGDMGELGDFTDEGHASMGKLAAELGMDRLYCIGGLSKGIADAALASGMPNDAVWHTMDAMEALSRLKGELESGDAVLVKASHSMALERIVEGLAD